MTGTSQRPGTSRTTASLAVAVRAAAPGTGAVGVVDRQSRVPLVAVIAGILLGGGLLVGIARRLRREAQA